MQEFSIPHPSDKESERIIEISEIINETSIDDPRAEELLLDVDVEGLERKLKIARDTLRRSR